MTAKSKVLAALTGCLLATFMTTSISARAQEVTLRAVSVWPKNFFLCQSFQKYVDKLNAAGKGVVQINYVGGPEVIPGNEQAAAVRRGAIDFYFGSIAYAQGSVPEADALVSSTKSAAELRANGGFDLLDEILQKKNNSKLLAIPDRGWSFLMFLKNEPKLVDGKLDLTGLKLRSHPLYNGFLEKLGATPVVVQTTEMYTAFERGVVDGLAFSEIGIRDFKIEKFLKYRIYPTFYHGDIIMLVNSDKWKGLPAKAKDLMVSVAKQHEEESRQHFLKEVANEAAKLDEIGMKKVVLDAKGAADYLAKANSIPWSRLEKADPTYVERLKKTFQ